MAAKDLMSMSEAVAKIEQLEAELAAQEVSRRTYYAEWEERAKNQAVLIEQLKTELKATKTFMRSV